MKMWKLKQDDGPYRADQHVTTAAGVDLDPDGDPARVDERRLARWQEKGFLEEVEAPEAPEVHEPEAPEAETEETAESGSEEPEVAPEPAPAEESRGRRGPQGRRGR